MDDSDAVDRRLGERVRGLRAGLSLTLDELARRSGVSRAMISRIERGESSATAQLLGRLASALDVTLSALFAGAGEAASSLARRDGQIVWRDPGSGYVRRAVSPASAEGLVDLVEVSLPAGAVVAFERQVLAGVDQLVWVLDGALDMAIGEARHSLATGDCLHMRFDDPITFRNPGPEAVRYAVILAFARAGGAR